MSRGWRAVFLLFLATFAHGQDQPLQWVNAQRKAAGSTALLADDLLSRTAALWAGRLAAAGVLSHRGVDGSSVLDRYRSVGGTEAHVGEILGAGPDLAAIEKGWMESVDHRRLALDAVWTHVGWGKAEAPSGGMIWVMVFCQKLVADLVVSQDGATLRVSGRFLPAAAVQVRLLSGLEEIPAESWQGAARSFSFEIPDPDGYIRLGYVSPDSLFTLTNAFTWPPETEFPAGPGRFAGPAASP